MTTTPRIPGRLLAWVALSTALAASVAANVAYARPELGPRLSASTAPVLTVLAAGLLERVPLATARRWQRWLAWLGLGAVATAAFVTSYQHQYELLLAYGNPALSAVLLPIAVDGLIVLASVCLAVIAERRRELSTPDIEAPVIEQVSDRTVSTPRPRRYAPSAAEKVATYTAKNPTATPATIAKRIGVSERTVRRHLAPMVDVDSGERVNGHEMPALVEVF